MSDLELYPSCFTTSGLTYCGVPENVVARSVVLIRIRDMPKSPSLMRLFFRNMFLEWKEGGGSECGGK